MIRRFTSSPVVFAILPLVAALGLLGCTTSSAAGAAANARRAQAAPQTIAGVPSITPVPQTQNPSLPSPTVAALSVITFTSRSGIAVPMSIEIADTEALRECGLMNRTRMPDDQGMIFAFTEQVDVPFWMKDTLIDLSVAFVDSSGTVVDVQEMKAESLDTHSPAKPYQYAIEANAGWYTRHAVAAGDTVDLSQVQGRPGSQDSCHLTPDSTS